MKRLLMTLAGAAFLLSAGCPVQDMAGMPDWTMYGKIKADFSRDSDDTSPADGDFVRWVNATAADDPVFTMGANDTRIGFKFGDPEVDEVTGRFEVDFHDNDVLLRHAYVEMNLGEGVKLLAGQASDVFSPLLPSTLNWYVGWYAGNTGHRSPQFRFTWAPGEGPVDVQVAMSDPQDDAVGMPDIQARAGIKLSDAVKLGASMVTGSYDPQDDLFGTCVDVVAKLGDTLTLKGEYFIGKNLVGYMGNIGLAPTGGQPEIGTMGMWVQATMKLSDTLTVNAGYMFESNDSDDLNANDPDDNSCIFGNAIFKLNDNTDVGIEISSWETEYLNDAAYDDLRIQGSVIVKF